MQNVQNILSEIKYDGVSVIGEAAFCKTENITVRKREIYAPNVSSDEIPKEKEIVYFNRLTGRDETVTGRLVQIGEEQSAVWEDTITGEIIFQTADENGDEWIMPDGRHVSMKIDTDIPNWDTMTEDLPILTGIKSENYTLSGIEWSGDIYESEGQWKR